MTAAGTIGTTPAAVRYPMPLSASHLTTPSAAASPNALPPVNSTAWTSSSRRSRCSNSSSRELGEEPRTSQEDTLPGGGRTTVQPVAAPSSVKWPTLKPASRLLIG